MQSYDLYPYRQQESIVRLAVNLRGIFLEVNNDNVHERLRERAEIIYQDEKQDASISRLLGTPNPDKTYDLFIVEEDVEEDVEVYHRYIISTMDDLRLRNGNIATYLFEVSTRNDDEPIVPIETYRYADVFMRELKEFYDDNTVIDSESEDEDSDDEESDDEYGRQGKLIRKRRNKKVKQSKAKRRVRRSKAKHSRKLKRKLKSSR